MGLLDTYPDRYLPRCCSALKTIGTEEVARNEGRFFAAHFWQTGTSVNSIMITTAAAYSPTAHVAISSDVAGEWTLAEAPTCSGGTAVTAYNLDRTSTITASSATIVSRPTYTSTGTIISRHRIGLLGGEGTSGHERKLATAQSYIMQFTPGASANSILSIHFTEE